MTKLQTADQSATCIREVADRIQHLQAWLPERLRTWVASVRPREASEDLWPNGQPEISAEEEGKARAVVRALEPLAAPTTKARFVGHVLKVLHHAFIVEVDKHLFEKLLDDWVDDLGEFPDWAIEEACRQWRRTKPGIRPGPGHIRKICRMIVDRELLILHVLRQLLDGPPPRPDYVKLSWRYNPAHPDSDFQGPKWIDEFGRPVTRTGELLDVAPYNGSS